MDIHVQPVEVGHADFKFVWRQVGRQCRFAASIAWIVQIYDRAQAGQSLRIQGNCSDGSMPSTSHERGRRRTIAGGIVKLWKTKFGAARGGRNSTQGTSLFMALLVSGSWSLGTSAWAQNASAPQPFIEEQRQQERERALREQQQTKVDARVQPAAKSAKRLTDNEQPCFQIDRLALNGDLADIFQWALSAADMAGDVKDDWRGRCLGATGVNVILERVQQAVIAQGWVTTRVLVAKQDLKSGTLTLTVIPSRIAAIRFKEGSERTSLRSAIPAQPGDLLNIRDIEQALENFKRLPTVEAEIQIEASTAPNARPGDSDLVVSYRQKQPLRTTLSLDDGGTKETGKTQATATVAWDNPLGLNDLGYLSLNHDAFNHTGQGTSGQTLHYSVPYGYWTLGATASQSRYHQTIAGLSEDYVYAGETRNAELRLSRLIYRDQNRKTTVAFRGFRRASNNYIDDTEIEVQRRVVGGLEAILNHREFIGDATLDGTLAYRRGTGAFGALKAPEEDFGEGTSRLKLYTADVSLNAPFKLADETLRYTALWRAQWSRTPLTPLDRFAIGGRYTVRGFDGETSLLGDRGWLVRNDIGWALGQSSAELYAGIDYGEVGGQSTQYLLGRHLAGGAIGVRGATRGVSYDIFIGAPISKPEGYRTAKVTGGISLSYSF